MSEAMLSKVSIRGMAEGEDKVCEPIWRAGFHEMWRFSYSRMLASRGFWGFLFVNNVAGVLLLRRGGDATWWELAIGAFLCGFSLSLAIPPLGGRLFSLLLWQAIRNQRFLFRPGKGGDLAYFVALAEGRIVGCVCVKSGHTLVKEAERGVAESPLEASVWRLSVDASARRLGVGKALMAEAEAHARGRGCKFVSLITGNEDSRRFYLALGYQSEEERRARSALFGPGGQPSTLFGRVRLSFLPRRLQSTILYKPLL